MLLANDAIDSSLSTLFSTLLAVGAAMIAASAVVGALLAGGALRPIERMRRQADAIPGDALDRRLSEGSPDELGRLAAAFNRLLARAERATEEQQRFVADASHELRTPVTALQGHARIVARAAERGDLEQVHESAGIVSTESERLARTLTELLSLAEAERSERVTERVRLDEVVREACDELRFVHEGRLIEADLAAASVMGDAGRLGELVRILIDNAIKYSPAEQPVLVTVTNASNAARVAASAITVPACRIRTANTLSTASTAAVRRRTSRVAVSALRSLAASPCATGRCFASRTHPAAARSRRSSSARASAERTTSVMERPRPLHHSRLEGGAS